MAYICEQCRQWLRDNEPVVGGPKRVVIQTQTGPVVPQGGLRYLFHERCAPRYGYLLGPVTTLAKMGLTQS
jgi:hypothetical protein